MLLFLLCAGKGTLASCFAFSVSFRDPSAVLLNPWMTGELSAMGLDVVSPVRGAFAGTVWIRGVCARASPARALLGEVGMAASGDFFWLDVTLVDEGVVKSVSAVVDVDRLLDDDGNFGPEKVLDTTERTDS